MNKKFIAKLMALVLVLTLLPATILAAGAANGSNDGCNKGCNDGCNRPAPTIAPEPDTRPVVDTQPVVNTTEIAAADVKVENGEVAITAKVVDGVADVVLSDAAVAALADQVTGDSLVLNIAAENATQVDVSLSAKSLTELGQKTGASLTISTPLVSITIPNSALTSVFGTTGTVKISAQASGTSVGFSISVSGKTLPNIKGLKVEF